MLSDLKQTLRSLFKRPITAGAIVALLVIGLGSNITLFALVDAVLLRGLPFPDPDRLVTINNRYGEGLTAVSPPDFVDRRDQARTLRNLAAFSRGAVALRVSEEATHLSRTRATSQFFEVMDVAPLLGVANFPFEESESPERVAVLSHDLWQSTFASSRSVVGSKVQLDGVPFVIQGVMPPGFDFPRGTDLWTPIFFSPAEVALDNHGNEYLEMVGRLHSGIAIEAAQAELDVLASRFIERAPDRQDYLTRNAWSAQVQSLRDRELGVHRGALLVLLGALGLLLLLICANVANLLLAMASGRSREMATRSALGASRSRLVRQILTESQTLAVAGCIGGLAASWLAIAWLPRWLPHDLPHLDRLGLDLRVVGAALLLALLTGLLVGILPAMRLSALRGSTVTHGVSGTRTRNQRAVLATVEVAVAVVLMCGAGLLLRSFWHLSQVDTGFDADRRLAFAMSLPSEEYSDDQRILALQSEMLSALGALPGVQSVALSDRLPLDGQRWTASMFPQGSRHLDDKTPGASVHLVSPDYFATLGIPLLAGRGFSWTDQPSTTRVVVVNDLFAERYWPEGAIANQINVRGPGSEPALREVIGVVGSVRENGLAERPEAQVYFAASQVASTDFSVTLLLEREQPESLAEAVRNEVGGILPGVPIFDLRSLDEVVQQSVALERFNLLMLCAFAAVALLLAAVGLYAMLSFSVSHRTAELGIRMALGAPARRIVGSVLGEGMLPILLGLLLGALAALALGRVLAARLFGVSPQDPTTLAVVSAVLLLVGLVAILPPALRASRVDPVNSLRSS